MPSSTLPFPLEAFFFDGVTFVTTVDSRAYIKRLDSADEADFEMCAFFFFAHLFSLTPRTQRLDYVLVCIHGGGGPLWPEHRSSVNF
jgi:hypothetical protein